MFRVDSGDEGKAVVALLPQVIGNIQTATGCGTLERASGVVAQAKVGDPVCPGDVIETAADGRIGIRFIDGTVFNLSRSTRVALNEFVCDANGGSHSALFGVTRGTFGFIAGQVAKTGGLSVDTPVGTIRGRAYAGGVGMLSLAALALSAMKEVQAADPNVTFLDDDSITYKDLDHGVFELVTKEAIPRRILVEDPGETIVLSPRGSTISVNQVTNTATRMEELQAAQQGALANFAKGLGPTGSSTPPLVSPLPLQRVNFIQADALSAEQDSLPPLPFIINVVPEIVFNRVPPPPPPPSLTVAAGPTEIDTVTFDAFAATSGTFVASSSNSDTLIYGISGGTVGNTVLGGVTYDVSRTGSYGTLYLNSTTGAYTFVPDSGAINALTTTTTEGFTVTVFDGTLSAHQTFTVTINGTNDAAIISGTTAGSAIEAGGVANATPGTPTATGTLTDTDVDHPPNTFTAVSSPTASAGGYGTFTMTTAGVWTYTLNDTNSAVQALNLGGTLTDSFTVTTVDGTAQVVTITITGTNDAAIISGTTTGSVIEAGATPGTPTATGTLTDTDVDGTPNSFTAVSSPTASAGGYGTFTMTTAGVWTYMLDDANSAVQALNVGGVLTDSFTVTTADGTAQVVTVAITGTGDAAIVSGTTAGSVIEAGGVANATPGTPTATGTLTDIDVDNPSNTFTAVSSPTASAGGYGTFTMTAAGVWTYILNDANSAVQALNVGGTLTDSFTVTTVDGTAQVVTITITGTNDAAIISGTTTGSVIEAGATPGKPTATGTLTDTDVDGTPNSFTAVSSPTASAGGYGTFTMTAAGLWVYMLDDANSAVQALDVGDVLTDTFTVTTVDGTAQVVTVTINGASDADPNDFDSLAMGTEVIVDPPQVFGTPGGETIAGGGHDGQIIYAGAGNDTVNGTGQIDLLYGGSGNDTLKGNDGADTIYGGSGNDTINGSNESDIIVGGFGADGLTGSNGDDRFVYLSVADSSAGQFDTISDFISGTDRINLAALGAIAFSIVELTSASTSVPAHTIAWIYDSSANETIVYVNPTEQTLSIGSSGLLEIHLQGVSAIQAADFVPEPTTAPAGVAGETVNPELAITADNEAVATMSVADASFDWTVNDEALLADGDWTAQSTDVGYGFDATRGQIDPIGYARFTSFGEVWTHSTEDIDGNAAIAPANGQSVVLQGIAATATETNFEFDQTPVRDSADATAIGHGPAMPLSGTISNPGTSALDTAHWNIVSVTSSFVTPHNEDHANLPNARAIDAVGTHVHTIDAGPDAVFANSIAASHLPRTHGGNQTSSGNGNDGNAARDGAGAPDFAASSTADVVSGSGIADPRGLGDSFHFRDRFEGSGVTNPGAGDHTPRSIGHGDNTGGSRGPRAISEEAQAIDLSLPEQPSADHFGMAPGHARGAFANHVPHDLMV